MNVDQIIRLALFQANQVKQAGTASSFVTTTELVAWTNDANRRVESAVRALQEDYFTRVMNSSTDTTAQRIFGISYTPSTSLRLAASTNRFTLPPDFQSMKSVRCVTSSFEYTRFFPLDISQQRYQSLLRVAPTDTMPSGNDVYYDIIGERTLYIVRALDSALDIEIVYVARTRPLTRYATGTISVTDATTTVTGSGTVWSTNTPFDANYLDILFGASGNSAAPTPDPTWDYDQVNMAKVASIESDTSLTLAANKNGTLAANTGYILSSVPQVPPEYHYALVEFVTAKILMKRGSQGYREYMGAFQAVLNDLRSTASVRQEADVQTVDTFLPTRRA